MSASPPPLLLILLSLRAEFEFAVQELRGGASHSCGMTSSFPHSLEKEGEEKKALQLVVEFSCRNVLWLARRKAVNQIVRPQQGE